jgi:hypothetical protein
MLAPEVSGLSHRQLEHGSTLKSYGKRTQRFMAWKPPQNFFLFQLSRQGLPSQFHRHLPFGQISKWKIISSGYIRT